MNKLNNPRPYRADPETGPDLRTRLEVEHGVVGHPRASKVWALAWQYGHANGENEVEIHYDDFVELIK